MIVIIDTNIVFPDLQLANADFATLRLAATQLGIQVVLPGPVIEEVVRHYKIELDKEWREARGAIRRLKYLTDDQFARREMPEKPEIDYVETYRHQFTAKLGQLGAKVRRYPSITHMQIMQRLAARAKPFKENGAGYSDTLIWETVKEVARESEPARPVYLLTDNIRDFGENGDSQLASTLANELAELGLPPNKVTLVRSLGQFIETYITPRLVPLQELIQALNTGEHFLVDALRTFDPNNISDLRQTLIAAATDEFGSLFELDLDVYYVEPRIRNLRFQNAQQIDETYVRVTFNGDLDVTFSGFINRVTAWDIDENALGIEIWDRDWNDYYAYAVAIGVVTASLTAVVNSQTNALEAVGIEDVVGLRYGNE